MRSDESRVSKSRASSPDGRGVTPPISEPFPINPQTSASPNAGQPLATQKRVRQTIIIQQHSVRLAFFRNAGLPAELCRSAASQGKFLEYAAEALDDSTFGLHLAKEANPREEGLLFYVTSAATNIEGALALFARYSRIANERVRIKTCTWSGGVTAEISFIGLPRHAAKQVTEFGLGVTIKALREIAGRNIRPTH
jgi:hypothetical protein